MNAVLHNAIVDAHVDNNNLIARASGLVETLRSRTREVDELARLPENTVADLDAIGAFDLMIPRQHGGLQTSVRTYMEVVSEIGRGDASAGWACALINICNWMLATLYPKAVSDPIFASGGKVRSSGVLSPRKPRSSARQAVSSSKKACGDSIAVCTTHSGTCWGFRSSMMLAKP